MAVLTAATLNQELHRVLDELEGRKMRRFLNVSTATIMTYSDAKTPVMTAHLINSSYRNVVKNGNSWKAVAGYRAEYAGYVHDAPGTYLNAGKLRIPSEPSWGYFWDPDGEPKFLQKAIDKYIKEDFERIAKRELGL